ncbi:unnamed protein product [Paramecium pentaurelia]|uniref:Uncharacterized protein n=1 Tax=Paramecium pentaurelia TaxID=43138 RepID=A0A8S1UT99_9CILI|nr:unnamed protein product [Paramecium pentaurelia]
MQKIQNFIENNKAVVAIAAVAAAIGIVGIKALNSDNRGSAKILDASIQKVPLIERLGGEQAVQPLISLIFDRISNNKDLKPLFQNVEKSKVQQHFNAVVLYLFGGKPTQTQTNFSDHCKLNITEAQFELILNLLDQILRSVGVDNREINDAREAFLNKKYQIVIPNKNA